MTAIADSAINAAPNSGTTKCAWLTYTTQLTTKALRGHLFALSQYCRRVSDVTQEDTVSEPSAFHSVEEPPIDLADYVIGAAVKCRLNKATVLVAVAYVGVYSRSVNRLPSILSIHRLVAASLFIAAKVLQPRQVGATSLFGASLGLCADELLGLSSFVMDELQRHFSTDDVLPSDAQLEELYQKLEVARAKSLRGDFASAVAAALQLPVPAFTPTPPRKRASESVVITSSPSGLDLGAAASATSFLQPPAEWGSSALPSAECSPFGSLGSPGSLCSKSPLSPFLSTVGSGIRAARSLRLDQQQLQEQPQSQPCVFQTPFVCCYPLPTFESQIDTDGLVFLLPPVPQQPQPPAAPPTTLTGRRH